jgi:hypothetical protein
MKSTRVRSAIFYGGCLIVLVLFATKALNHVLPERLARELNDESEALPIAILFCAYVQYIRVPWAGRGRDLWLLTGALAAAAFVIAWLLLHLDLPSSIATWNESFVAVGAMILYACLPRPIHWAPLLSIILLVGVVAFQSTDFITSQAESAIPIILVPLALDWADRTILQPDAPSHPLRRLMWCVFLVVVPLVARAHVSIGSHHDLLRFERRATEGFVGLLLITLYFSYWLGDRWAPGPRKLTMAPAAGVTESARPASDRP